MKHNPTTFYRLSCEDREFDDYLLLGGGTDIDPNIYGEKACMYTQYPNKIRDIENIRAIKKAVKEGKPIFGVCRGLQLLDAVFGGKLIQHSVGHPSKAKVMVFKEKSLVKEIDGCAECHHQVVDQNHTKGEVIAVSDYTYKAYNHHVDRFEERSFVPEIVFWPEKKALAVQFHPEWHQWDHEMNVYLRDLIKDTLGLENVL